MKTTKINTLTEQSFDHNKNSTVLHIENDYALDIFGINNENLDFIEELLPLKIFQKGWRATSHLRSTTVFSKVTAT